MQTSLRAQILMVTENPNQISHATTALAGWAGGEWDTVHTCTAAVEWLNSHAARLVIVLLRAENCSGLSSLRQIWQGPLLCLCEDNEESVDAVETVQGLVIMPPYAVRQIQSALNYLLNREKPTKPPDVGSGLTLLFLPQFPPQLPSHTYKQKETADPSAQRYQLVTHDPNEMIWEWDLATGHIAVSQSLIETLGYESKAWLSAYDWCISHVHPDDQERVATSLKDALDSSKEFWAEEYRFLRGDNLYLVVLCGAFIQRDPTGHPYRIVGSLFDMRHHDRNKEALRESERRLENAQRMEAVGRLAGEITHDFNNLLTVIGSYSDLAIRKLDEGHVVRRYVEQIRKASVTAATLTQQLLTFTRRHVPQPRILVINEVVDEISFMLQSLLGTGIELQIRLDPELGKIEADPGQLQQVLLNLVVNAKDAMPDGGLLTIETRNFEMDSRFADLQPNTQAGSYVRLTVADTGIGMDQQTLAQIYEPFFTTKPKGRGTGLGLPTVYSIVQQSDGYISVYSEVGIGATFHIYLPRVDKVLENLGDKEETVGALQGHETILLVEDERPVRELTHSERSRISGSRSGDTTRSDGVRK